MTEAIRQRQAVDLDEFERRLRAVAPTSKPAEDPLAELARLVGQDDPFRQVFAEPSRSESPRRGAPRVEPPRAEPVRSLRKEPSLNTMPDSRPGSAAFAELRATSGAASNGEAVSPQPPYWERHRTTEAAEAPPRSEPADTNFYGAPKPVAPPYDDGEPWLADDAQMPPPEQARPAARSSRRGLYALTGVGGLAIITLAVLYTFKGAGVMGTTEPPTIKAASGPAKVAPASPAPDVADQETSVLDRNASDNRQLTNVVTREEQPVDLEQATNATVARTEELPANPPTPTMEPKKVKTVTVRPDGTIVSDDASAQTRSMAPLAMQPPAMSNMPSPVVAAATGKAQDGGKIDAAPMPKSATPKTTVRIAATPKAATGASGNGAPMAAKPKPILAKIVTPPPPAPTEAAEADPPQPQTTDTMPTGATGAATAAAGVGTFAVQLAAPASEQEARDLSSRLQKKFGAELSRYHPTIHRADAAGHQVYRVRVGNLTRDDAVSLCEKLKAGGGACFIAKN